uniref:DDE Tnp4 domain-containing protein n=1 Tax=Anguilla anguilla TaxID=7936 RepID=A0A0E9WU51_ANGAN
MIGIAPHGPITFVSALYAGSMSDREIFELSGISKLLTADTAIMVDKGFLVDTLVPCKVYRPAFLSKNIQMCLEDVQQTQSVARLRVHVERCIRRVKENKLFDKVIPLPVCGSIDQLFSVACLLVNYQNGPLVKAWAGKHWFVTHGSYNLMTH